MVSLLSTKLMYKTTYVHKPPYIHQRLLFFLMSFLHFFFYNASNQHKIGCWSSYVHYSSIHEEEFLICSVEYNAVNKRDYTWFAGMENENYDHKKHCMTIGIHAYVYVHTNIPLYFLRSVG